MSCSEFELDEHFNYQQNDLNRELSKHEIPKDVAVFQSSAGFSSNRRNNLYYMDESTMLTAVGNTVQLIGKFLKLRHLLKLIF